MMVEQTLASQTLAEHLWAWHAGISIVGFAAFALAVLRGAVASSRLEPLNGRLKCLIWAFAWAGVGLVYGVSAWGVAEIHTVELYIVQFCLGLAFAITQLISFFYQDSETSRRKIAKTMVVSPVPDVQIGSILAEDKKLADSQLAFRVVPVPEPGQSQSALMKQWDKVVDRNAKLVQLV